MTMILCRNKPLIAILARALLGLCIVGLSTSVHALGLGNIRIMSALDEPLVAEIELTSPQPSAMESLQVELGSVEDFQRAGVNRSEHLLGMEFELTTRDGTPIIRVTTVQPAREPFLHFLVTAKWSGGRLLREYTALLDPPKYTAEAPAPVSPPRETVDAGSRVAAEPTPMVEPQLAPPVAAPTGAQPAAAAAVPATEADVGRTAQYGPTEAGDTLWNIASSLDTGDPNVSVYQIMLALLRENPDAFIDNNINRLKKGQVLRLANIDAIGDMVQQQEAVAAYQAQLEEWQSYKATVAQRSGEVSVPSERAGTEPAAEPAQPTAAAAETEDVLKIVRATVEKERQDQADAGTDQAAPVEDLSAAKREVATLREQMLTLEESLASRELENRELRERVAMLESQVSNARRLMEIESQELAAAQQQAREQAEKAAAAEEAAARAAQAAAQAKATAAKPAPTPQVAGAQPQPAAKPKPAPPPAAAKPAAPKPTAKPGSAAARRMPSPAPEPDKPWWEGIMDTLFGSWMWMMAALVGLIVVVVGALLFLRRRRSIAEFEESILSGSALEGQTETTDTGVSSDGTDTSFLSDFGMAGMGSMQADEVDPLAEAEVYLAYGRDEQAEEVLKEAVSRNPDRAELKLKLLEIYEHRNDLKSFETIAEELYPAGGHGDAAIWQQVTKMGRKMNPDNPLFTQELPTIAAADGEAGGSADVTELDFSKTDEGVKPQVSSEDRDLGEQLSEELEKHGDTPVGPDLQPFPEPETDTNLEEQLDKLSGDADASAAGAGGGDELSAFQPGSDEETLNFATDNVSELDFRLDLDEPESGADDEKATAADIDTDLELDDLDFEFTDVEEEPRKEATGGERKAESAEATLEFEAEDIPPQETWGPASSDKPPGADDDRPALDLVDTGSAGREAGHDDEQWDEAATKLDLAKAYLDMGDKDGARNIIEEVMKEGNAAQRDQAAQLATQLG
jgi:pilus assembly protein FimV